VRQLRAQSAACEQESVISVLATSYVWEHQPNVKFAVLKNIWLAHFNMGEKAAAFAWVSLQ